MRARRLEIMLSEEVVEGFEWADEMSLHGFEKSSSWDYCADTPYPNGKPPNYSVTTYRFSSR
jgi:hypothetical protein